MIGFGARSKSNGPLPDRVARDDADKSAMEAPEAEARAGIQADPLIRATSAQAEAEAGPTDMDPMVVMAVAVAGPGAAE